MSYKVLVHPKVSKEIRELPKAYRLKLSELIDTLSQNPISFKKFDVRKLKGQKNKYRVRLGGFRLIYEVDKDEKLILILKIERRGRVHK